ncbi:type II secretion system major pseudopilin GspG [Candidatus Poribacteria bacterium]|nr:type II secretion system major pseudopilin GspG [Candidatus Poribacteria bacterium]
MRHLGTARPRAFTFIEIMFVVTIIGILTAIVASRIGGRMASVRIRSAETQLRSIASAIAQFELDTGAYPAAADGLAALVRCPDSLEPDVWRGPYLYSFEVPIDPWRREYGYREPGVNHPGFDVWSSGPDGMAGTNDDILLK